MRFPLAFDLKVFPIVVVGGGAVATRKCLTLCEFGANITVIAPQISEELQNHPQVKCIQKRIEMADLDSAKLVIAVTNNVDLNFYILKYCKEKGILIQAAGWVNESDFSFPALFQNNDALVAVFSKDHNPKKSIRLRNQFEYLLNAPDFGSQVILAGFGPGHPELMSLKTWHALFWADIIYYDDLIDEKILDLVVCEKEYVGKRKGAHCKTQPEINDLLLSSAKAGKKVLRLKGGDPFIFGRGGEELAYLSGHGISVLIIPGITSSLAASATAQIPLTMRGTAKQLTFMSGHHADTEHRIYPTAGTLVLYMGASKLSALGQDLIRSGWDSQTQVVLVQNASLNNEQIEIRTLSDLHNTPLGSPLSVIIGDVVREFNPN